MSCEDNCREIVLDMLLQVEKNKTPSHIVHQDTLAKYQYLEKNQRAFISKVYEGSLENIILIDYVINQFSKTPVNKMKPLIRCLMRLSVYQIMFMDKTPVSAVCNEAVHLVAKRGFKNLKPFVNGVLRNISRNIDNIKYPDISNFNEYMSVMHSIPMWIVSQVLGQHKENAKQIFESFSKHEEGICIRIREGYDVKAVVKSLEAQGIEVEPYDIHDKAFRIKGYDYLGAVEEFDNGSITVQDVSSMLVAKVLDPMHLEEKSNLYIVDLCSAPGGKAIHVAELIGECGIVDARDVSDYKKSLIEENIERMNINNIQVSVKDATSFDESIEKKADAIIADLPCSGLGVISKKSDIKYNMTKEGQDSLVKLQRDILANAVRYLKKSGTLVYSTCTINVHENYENYKWLKDNFDMEPVDISEYFKDTSLYDRHELEIKQGYISLLPGVDGTDGFFISKFRKK